MWRLDGELFALLLTFFVFGCGLGRGLVWWLLRRSSAAEARLR